MSDLGIIGNSRTLYEHLQVNYIDAQPVMTVGILGKQWPALLDSGSTISILGGSAIDVIKEQGVTISPAVRNFTQAAGHCSSIGSVYLTIIWPGGSKRQHFALLPELHRAVLLGRDFLIACNVNLHLKERGWTVGLGPQEIVPFDKDILSSPSEAGGNCSRRVTGGPSLEFETLVTGDKSLENNLTTIQYPVTAESCHFIPEVCSLGPPFEGSAGTWSQREELLFCEPQEIIESNIESMVRGMNGGSRCGPGGEGCLGKALGLEAAQVAAEVEGLPDGIVCPIVNAKNAKNDLEVIAKLLERDDLPPHILDSLSDLLNKYQDTFTSRPGLCTLFEHRIDTQGHAPIACKPRPMTPAKRSILQGIVDDMVSMDLIEKCSSPWASPVVLVSKEGGGHRMTLDLRSLNSVTRSDAYAMHRVDEMLACLSGATVFSSIDLTKGYWQIPVAPEDRDKTAFHGPDGLYRCKRAPFGEKNSGATFQRAMDTVLGDLLWKNCLSFVDDVFIFSNSLEDHLRDLDQVFSKLRAAGFTINPSKVVLFQKRIKFLGFIIEEGKHRPDPKKLDQLVNYPVPKTAKHIQRFLGFVGFYRHFFHHYDQLSRPLYRLLRKDAKFKWEPSCEEAFNKLCTGVKESTFLYMPNLNEQFVIQCDASGNGLGCVLANYRDGKYFPVWFASKSLTGAEKNYCTTEQECLAVVWAVRKFRAFIEYSHFIVETDHQALTWLMRIKDPIGRLARWSLELQSYDFEIRYRKGANNEVADTLSRMHELALVECDDIMNLALLDHEVITREEIKMAQAGDPTLASIIQNLNTKLTSNGQEAIRGVNEAKLSPDGILLKFVGKISNVTTSDNNDWKIWLPDSLIQQVMSFYHNSILSGHMSASKTLQRVASRFWFHGIRRKVLNYVKNCKTCQLVKPSQSYKVGIGRSHQATSPWDSVSVDLMGPYVKGYKGCQFLLVVVCNYTKYVELFGLRRATARIIIDRLWRMCLKWGFPSVIISDNGSQFKSKAFQSFCTSLGIKSYMIATAHPRANPCERYNHTVKDRIVAAISECKEWDTRLDEIAFSINTAVNGSTSFSPVFLNFGRELKDPQDNILRIQSTSVRALSGGDDLAKIRSIASTNLNENQSKSLEYFNKGRKAKLFSVGDRVLIRSVNLSNAAKGITGSLLKKFRGPFIISRKYSDSVYEVRDTERKKSLGKIHVENLKPFVCTDD